MNFIEEFKTNLFKINDENFVYSSLKVFEYQFLHNPIYNLYCNQLEKSPKSVHSLEEIPFLPIEFFRNQKISTYGSKTQKVFRSSGTTGGVRSAHHIPDLAFYHKVAKRAFEDTFGQLATKKIVALLPSYLEQGDSSLISMVDAFIRQALSGSDYFLGEDFKEVLKTDEEVVLIGVSFALLDMKVDHLGDRVTIIETGGMKGRKKEITREELHQKIAKITGISDIWSEYGMTELQSQAYGMKGHFFFPSWAKVLIREVNDPFSYLEAPKTGGINVIDLANFSTCSFIETKDLGKKNTDGSFEVLGRMDNSDVRGCNLLV